MSEELPRLETVFHSLDSRGSFSKPFSFSDRPASEVFYSRSSKGVIRGMHHQEGPKEGWRQVSVLRGSIFDVCLNPKTMQVLTFELSYKDNLSIWVPASFLHGFQALEPDTTVLYVSELQHDPKFDTGVHPLSIPVNWPLGDFSMSERDSRLPQLSEYVS